MEISGSVPDTVVVIVVWDEAGNASCVNEPDGHVMLFKNHDSATSWALDNLEPDIEYKITAPAKLIVDPGRPITLH